MSRVLLTLGILTIATPALAYPTEVDPGELRDKRLATVRHYRQEARLERERRQAEAEAAAEPQAQAAEDAPTTAAYPSGVLTAEQVASYARAAGFPESVIPTMVQIAYRESRFNPSAQNPSGACGLWQIYPAQSGCLNPATNAALAFAKYQAAGLSPWGY